MAPPYAIIIMGDLEEKILKIRWRYIDDILMFWQHGENF